MRRLPDAIQRELDRIPGRWDIRPGARHMHICIDDRLVAILPRDGGNDSTKCGQLNVRSQIRRAIAGREP